MIFEAQAGRQGIAMQNDAVADAVAAGFALGGIGIDIGVDIGICIGADIDAPTLRPIGIVERRQLDDPVAPDCFGPRQLDGLEQGIGAGEQLLAQDQLPEAR